MAAKVQRIAKAVREDSVGVLAREAMLRVSRRFNLSRFQAEVERVPEVQYRYLGYYKPMLTLLSPHDREAIIRFADLVLAGRIPLMGYGNVALGAEPDWHQDWVSGKHWAFAPSSSLPVVRHDGSDVKAPWELSRLQFLPVLAKAGILTGDDRYRKAACDFVSDWIDRNPVGIGVNWTLAMEAALRGISLCLLLELMWPLTAKEEPWLEKVTRSLWQHLLFIEAHKEFSHLIRSNHYLSNIVGLTTLSAVLHGPAMDKRFTRYAHEVQREILLQTYEDGGDWEASTGYHALVSQMFLHSYLVQKARGTPLDVDFEQRLTAMFQWMAILADRDGVLPHLGDCDDGRVELLLDDIMQASLPAEQRNSLCLSNYLGLASHLLNQPFGSAVGEIAWFGGHALHTPAREPQRVELLNHSGLAVARTEGAELIFCAMPNGINGKGSHTHSDKLSFVLRLDGSELFCDSGTRCYTRDARLRNRYRSAVSHNVVAVDYQEHNSITLDKEALFRAGNEAAVSPIEVLGQNGAIVLAASHEGYARFGVHCTRTLHLRKNRLSIRDEITGGGNHDIAIYFQVAPEWAVAADQVGGVEVGCSIFGSHSVALTCTTDRPLQLHVENSEISRAYGSALLASRISVQTTGELPLTLVTTIEWKQ
jgi:hypothetical protein